MQDFNYDLQITEQDNTEPETTLDEWLKDYDINLISKLLEVNLDILCIRAGIDLDNDQEIRELLEARFYDQLQDIYSEHFNN